MPGLLMVAVYATYIWVRVRMNPNLAPPYTGEAVTWRYRFLGLAQMSPLGIIVIMVMGFILLGVTTPSEAAATGAIGAFIVAALYRRLTFRVVKDSLYGTLYIGGMIFLIITGAVALGQLLAFTGATPRVPRVHRRPRPLRRHARHHRAAGGARPRFLHRPSSPSCWWPSRCWCPSWSRWA